MFRAAVVIGLTISLACAGGAAARRDGAGLWYGFGLASGWARVTCTICAGDRKGGMSAFAGLGGSTSRSLRIGAEFAAWRHQGGNVTQTLTAIGVAAYWFPT